jgi:hypothetical protein
VILAEIRCKTCRKLLDEVISAPPTGGWDWSYYVRVQICQRHGDGAGHGNVRQWQERQRRAGKDPDRVQTHRWIQWAELRPAVEKARRTNRTQVHVL